MITIAIAQKKLNEYLDAESAVLEGRTVTQNGRTLTMVDLPSIIKGQEKWERKLSELRSKGASSGPGFVRFL